MKESVDLRGLTCPEPVIRTKKLFDRKEIDLVEALVDDDVCVNNLQRLAKSLKAHSNVEQKNGYFEIRISRQSDGQPAPQQAQVPAQAQNAEQEKLTVIFLAKDTFGEGDPEFSRTLVNLFLQTALDAGHQPRAILMANTGVKLLDPDSPVLKVLNDFKDTGCEVLACGLCLEFYGLKEQVPKEQITNMFAICEYLFAADKVLSP
jgi:selenium metabolism protein YedF